MPLQGMVLLWVLFIVIIVTVLTIDLLYIGKKKRPITLNESLFWTSIWISLALAYNALIWLYFAKNNSLSIANTKAFEFFTAYLIEETLSLDNLFIFVLIFKNFSIPINYQRRLLFFGVLGAIFFRFIIILCGIWLVKKFDWIFYIFGIMLIYSAIRIISLGDKKESIENNLVFTVLSKIFPIAKDVIDDRFFRKIGRKIYVTPLFIVLIFIELSDLVFAIDSIPAVFAVTNDPFIAFTSNAFAVIGLRSLYFVLANIPRKFKYFNIGMSIILGWIGMKMLIHEVIEIPITLTLSLIILVLSSAVIFSKLRK
jgi:tellurite resistance protein TerC